MSIWILKIILILLEAWTKLNCGQREFLRERSILYWIGTIILFILKIIFYTTESPERRKSYPVKRSWKSLSI